MSLINGIGIIVVIIGSFRFVIRYIDIGIHCDVIFSVQIWSRFYQRKVAVHEVIRIVNPTMFEI